jgi:hypothetical protein
MIRHAPSIGLGLGLSLRGGGGVGFQGLLDLYPGAAAAYSLQALSSGWVAGDVVEVRRSSDSATQSFTASQITNGSLVAFCGAGDGYVSRLYDQSGFGNDATQAVTTSQPKIVSAGALVDGGMLFDNVDDVLETINTESFGTSSRSIFAVCAPNSITANADGIVQLSKSVATGEAWLLTPEVATRANLTTWISSTPATLSQSNLISNIYTSGNLHAGNAMWLNGAGVARTSGTDGSINTGTSEIRIGQGLNTSTAFDGAISEIVIYKSDQSANREGIETNINNRYNIYTPPVEGSTFPMTLPLTLS